MNLQVIAIRSDADRATDQSVTHYKLLDLNSFYSATLSKPQVVVMVESGTTVSVVKPDGVLIPCAVNSDGANEKWLQGQDGDAWTDDVLALPRVQDINGAEKVRRYTTKSISGVNENE